MILNNKSQQDTKRTQAYKSTLLAFRGVIIKRFVKKKVDSM